MLTSWPLDDGEESTSWEEDFLVDPSVSSAVPLFKLISNITTIGEALV